ncbi:Pollen allergen Che a 1 [Sesamum alatum]|uniref:Pollen allergen Che a 1 n=1 Tax=Sesamum alatum TaxID=300844 RepID=A0AAE2CZD8_9LAMI|nr:Pollen allergen Che a 1 [Sesamum alatum]
MAKLTQVAIVLAGALCLLSLAQVADSNQPQFIVKGKVYCDVCRANFVNRFSKPMPGAEVKLECREEESEKVTYRLTGGVTDHNGEYTLAAEGDHGEEYCEVTMVKSGQHDCDEIPTDGLGNKPVAEITLTANNGFHDEFRHANPLYYTTKKRAPQCAELDKELADDKEDEEPLP